MSLTNSDPKPPRLYLDVIFVLMAFTFAGSRLIRYFMRANHIPEIFLDIGGIHIHHFVYGIILVTIAGYWALHVKTVKARYWCAGMYAVGLGLIYDEFGIWIKLRVDIPDNLDYAGIIVIFSLFLLIGAISRLKRRKK